MTTMGLREWFRQEIERLDSDDEGLWQKIEELKKRVEDLESKVNLLIDSSS